MRNNEKIKLKVIAHIYNDFSEKFGVPRQSGMAKDLKSKIIFENEYRNPDAFRELDGYSKLWIIWGFSENSKTKWTPMVRPPRLGGNRKAGVFATRSPYRPNPIGLSCVDLDKISFEATGPVLYISGADMINGTPIYDIKPYVPSFDSFPQASGGFAEENISYRLEVDFPKELLYIIPAEKRSALIECLSYDPRPAYHNDNREYGMSYAGYNIRFIIENTCLKVFEVEEMK